ncbi:hypothetical protein [Altererythrobacter sp. MF3-039]|uniref:hypothetical protein n=1 Tax=Altererythrobacter sp. MF3-039 TaxID=3252901 RepID=UPI00390CCFA7
MARVTPIAVPQGSLLAGFSGPGDYSDCFCAEAAREVTLGEFIEGFYSSMAFLPERVVLGLMGRGAPRSDIQALARGETDRIAVWKVVERTDTPSSGAAAGHQTSEILLESKGTGTASWLCVSSSGEPAGGQTRLLFGSWVGNLEQSVWRSMLWPHIWYSRTLLASALKSLSQ